MNTPSSLLGVLFDHTIGNILRMLAVIRLPKLERGRVSRGFVATLIVIMGYGLVMLFSASYSSGYANYGDVYHFIRPQSIIAVAGLGVMWLVSNINYRALRYMNESFYIITLVLLVAALYFGQQVYDILFVHDNVANFMHIVGGLCGTAFGYYSALHSRRKPAKAVKFTSSNRRRKH